VAHAWGVGQAIPVPQLRPFFYCCADFQSKKYKSNLNFFLGWGCSVQTKHAVFSNKSRKNSSLPCRCSNNIHNTNIISSLEWDWNRWNRHFSEIEQAESFASVLKVPLFPLPVTVSSLFLSLLFFFFFLVIFF
jgi:hypothetical protein